MVDETNDTGARDESSIPQRPQTTETNSVPAATPSVEVPQILEEHIVAAAPVKNISPVPPVAKKETPIPEVSKPNAPAPAAGAFASMLASIKLPGRADAPVSEPQQKYDTSLTLDPKNEAQKKAAQENALQTARTIADKLSSTDRPSDDVRALHTLKDDLQNVVRDKKISLVRAVALEEEKRYRTTASEEHLQMQSHKESRVRFGVIVVVLLFIIGALAIGAVLYIMSERTQGTPQVLTSHILFAEQSVPLPIDNLPAADIRRQIANARNSGALTLGAILQIIPTAEDANAQTPVSFARFVDASGANAPDELVRALGNDFFFGLHTVDENAPILIIPVASYERAFAGMLAWEKTMNKDLSPIFTLVPDLKVGADGLPTERVFEDTVMNNYDVRVLKDDQGTIQLYYSFPTRNILVVAESPYSFGEILSRLRADRKL